MSVTSWFKSHLDLRQLILPYHPEILALANQLGSVKNAYEYVRDQIKYVRDKGEVWRFVSDTEICQQTKTSTECAYYPGTLSLGFGDCIGKGEEIVALDANGNYKIITIESIQPNTRVLSYDFIARKWTFECVTDNAYKGIKFLYRVYLKNGTSFVCTETHKLFNRKFDKGKRIPSNSFVVRKLNDLELPHRSYSMGCRGYPCYPQIAVAHHIPILDKDRPSVSDSELWLLGHYVAEGCHFGSHRVISGYTADIPTMLQVAGIKYHLWRDSSGLPNYNVYSKQPLAKLIDECGMKAIDKQFPEWTLSLSKTRLLKILDGYTKGDGYIPKHDRPKDWHQTLEVMYTTISPKLTNQLRLIHWMLGKPVWTSCQKHGSNDNDVWKLYCLSSKIRQTWHTSFSEYDGLAAASVKKIEPIGEGPCYDITVEKTHNFVLAKSGVVVHNCDDKSLLLCSLIRALGDSCHVRVVEIPAGGHAYVMWHGRVLDATSTVPFERDIKFKNEHLIADFNDFFVEVYDPILFNRVLIAST